MPRNDLLAMTEADLEVFSNRGTVKRALKELDSGSLTWEHVETEDGTITGKWSDGVTCTLPGDKTIADGTCSCVATTLCRHLIRTVLAYQRASSHLQTISGPWDPGKISDEQLENCFTKQVLSAARSQFEEGLLIECVRSVKPMAIVHGPGSIVRFLVPNDPRYVSTDVTGPAAEQAAAVAVWAFRILPEQLGSGYVVTGAAKPSMPTELLQETEGRLAVFFKDGISALPPHFKDRLHALAERNRAQGLAWPAEILASILEEYERYEKHDSMFSPEEAVRLIGEWLIRADALTSRTGAVPLQLVAGTTHDRLQTLGTCRLIGLGCGVKLRRKGVSLHAYLQDSDTGGVVVQERTFEDTQKDFCKLADTIISKGIPLSFLASGQILTTVGKRTASYRLTLGRRLTANPQAFAWENIREPVMISDYFELSRRLAAMPPSCLRPLRAADNFYVLQVASVDKGGFDVSRQEIRAELSDALNNKAWLVHPYTHRGRHGSESLVTLISEKRETIRFVSGHVSLSPKGIVINPVAVIWEDQGKRHMIQPWTDKGRSEATVSETGTSDEHHTERDPLNIWLEKANSALGETLLLGLRRRDTATSHRWKALANDAESVGLARLAQACAALSEELDRRNHVVNWQPEKAVEQTLLLSVLLRLAPEVA